MITPFFSRALIACAICAVGFSGSIFSQPRQPLIDVSVVPEAKSWSYDFGATPKFLIEVRQNGHLLNDVEINYSIGLEQMPPTMEGNAVLSGGDTLLAGPSTDEAGFVRCIVKVKYEDELYLASGTAAFAPELIQPTVELPADFEDFWNNGKKELAKLPIDAELTLQPDLCTPEINVYHVSLQSVRQPSSWQGTSRFYGMLSMPSRPGRYPAILAVPGAGVRAYGRDDRASNGLIVLQVGIHGIPVNLPTETYHALGTGALAGYWKFGLEDKEDYYYKRVYLGCVRAVDFIETLPEYDGNNLAVTGGSQGGALSLIAAGLDDRIKYLAAYYPALSDLTGYLHDRAGGWPHLFRDSNHNTRDDWIKTSAYYDVVNFARKINIPGWYSWGFDDPVCPPTSMYAAFNSIEAPKELIIFQETEHWTYPEQRRKGNQWLYQKLGIQ